MPNIIIGVLLAIAGGIGAISFNKPEIYKKIFKKIIGPIFINIPIVLIWSYGYKCSFDKMLPLVSSANIEKANKVNDLQEFLLSWFASMGVVVIYLGILYWLSNEIINHANNKEPK